MTPYDADRATGADFGEQWSIDSDNEGDYGSVEYFFDIVTPLRAGAFCRFQGPQGQHHGFADRIAYHYARGDELPPGFDLDIIISIGVIHHIPDPAPTKARHLRRSASRRQLFDLGLCPRG